MPSQQPVVANASALVAAGLLALAQAAPSHAQLVRESKLIDDLGTCVVRAEPKKSKAVLDTQPGSTAERASLKTLALRATNCMKISQLQMPGWVLRGTIAAATLRANPAMVDRARSLPAVDPVRAVASNDNGVLMRGVFACAVGAEPAAALDLVMADLDTPALSNALARFQPGLQACVPEELGFKTTKSDIRVNTAEALFERVEARATMARN